MDPDVGGGDRFVCISTEPELTTEMINVRQVRKEMRRDHIATSAAQHEESARQRATLEAIEKGAGIISEKRRATLGTAVPIQPESAAHRLAYGVRKQHSQTVDEDRMLLQDPEFLPHIPDIGEEEAVESQRVYRRTHGLDNFGTHFMGREHFVEKRPGTAKQVAPAPTSAAPMLASRLKNLVMPKPAAPPPKKGSALQHDKGADGGTKRRRPSATAEEKTPPKKKARVEPALPPSVGKGKARKGGSLGNVTSHSQVAVADMVGMRDVTRDEMITATKIAAMDIKPKPKRGEYSIPTEAPPSGNESVRALERDCLTTDAFNRQAEESNTLATATKPATADHVLSIPTDDRLPTTPLLGTELRHVGVVDSQFFALDSVQETLLSKGQRNPLEAAKERRLASLLPAQPIVEGEARRAEQGRPEFLSDDATLRTELATKTREFLSSEKPSIRQPLVLYMYLFTKPGANKGWREEIVFDRRTKLNAAITQFELYLKDEDSALLLDDDEALAKFDTSTGFKTMTKISRQNARNIKKKRDNVGRKAEYEPSRLRMRFGHYKVKFFLRRLNQRDALFHYDWPQLEAGNEMRLDSPTKVIPARRSAAEINKLCTYGVIGRILDRHRKRIEDRGKRTGTNYMASAEDLGSDRLHPDCNPDIPDVSLKYHVSYMEQPGPNELGCVKGDSCFCFSGNVHIADQSTYFSLTSTHGFICKQFLLPAQELKWKMTGELPKERTYCIVDYIYHVNCLYHLNIQQEIRPTEPIINHSVRIGAEGEYSPDYMLLPSVTLGGSTSLNTGVPAPFPKFDASSFEHNLRRDPRTGAIIRCLRYRPGRMLF